VNQVKERAQQRSHRLPLLLFWIGAVLLVLSSM
jgi:hypothetical protein